jgi:transposase
LTNEGVLHRLTRKLVLAYESGEGTLDEVADTFGVGRCTVARMMKLWRAGQSLAPLPHGGGYPATLDKQLLALLTSQVALQPDVTLSELAAHLKEGHSRSSSLDCLSRCKSSACRVKVLRLRKSRSRPASLSSQSRPLDRRRFIFTDETGFHLAMTRAYGRGARHKSQPERAAQSRQG